MQNLHFLPDAFGVAGTGPADVASCRLALLRVCSGVLPLVGVLPLPGLAVAVEGDAGR